MQKYFVKLYVSGRSWRSCQAINNLRRICNDLLDGPCELQVVDVLQDPQLAETENILATPTAVKLLPAPQRRIIGDMSDRQKVAEALGLEPSLDETDTTVPATDAWSRQTAPAGRSDGTSRCPTPYSGI